MGWPEQRPHPPEAHTHWPRLRGKEPREVDGAGRGCLLLAWTPGGHLAVLGAGRLRTPKAHGAQRDPLHQAAAARTSRGGSGCPDGEVLVL